MLQTKSSKEGKTPGIRLLLSPRLRDPSPSRSSSPNRVKEIRRKYEGKTPGDEAPVKGASPPPIKRMQALESGYEESMDFEALSRANPPEEISPGSSSNPSPPFGRSPTPLDRSPKRQKTRGPTAILDRETLTDLFEGKGQLNKMEKPLEKPLAFKAFPPNVVRLPTHILERRRQGPYRELKPLFENVRKDYSIKLQDTKETKETKQPKASAFSTPPRRKRADPPDKAFAKSSRNSSSVVLQPGQGPPVLSLGEGFCAQCVWCDHEFKVPCDYHLKI